MRAKVIPDREMGPDHILLFIFSVQPNMRLM